MTPAELDEVLSHCPTFFHIAQAGSWESIQRYGLLSTSALLDLYGIGDAERFTLEGCRRGESVTLRREGLPPATLRDQKPMTDATLRKALNGSMSPEAWYRLLNQRVFFWPTRERLLRHLGAIGNRDREHDVLEVDARSLVFDHRARIMLSPINSGCSVPYAHPRDQRTLCSLDDYPYSMRRKTRRPGETIAEWCVLDRVDPVQPYVLRVMRMHGDTERRELYVRRSKPRPRVSAG